MRRFTALLIAAAGVCGCSSKEAAKPDSSAAPAASAPAPAAASAGSFDPTTHVATIHAKDFTFAAPDSITAGWTTFHLVNDGTTLHHAQIVRLDSGKTVADLGAALQKPGPFPAWAAFAGGANAPDPNTATDATVNLAPGNYALLCLVDVPDHVPHFAKGMIRPLTVTAASGPTTEPTADVTMTLSDYSFVDKPALTGGKHTIKVVNNGPQPHEFELARLAPGKTAKDLMTWIDKPVGPPPGNALGGVAVINAGTSGYFSLDLTPGTYALLCFVPDMKDGKPHVSHGMFKEVKIQ